MNNQKTRKKILIIVFNNLQRDARVLRQIDFLKDTYEVKVLCYGSVNISNVDIEVLPFTKLTFYKKIKIGILLLLRAYHSAYWLLYPFKTLIEKYYNKFHLIIANDVETLPFATRLSSSNNILLDAHEYSPRQFEDRLYWKVFFQNFIGFLCRNYLTKTAKITTVGNIIAKEYEKNFNVEVSVITNAPYYQDLKPSPIDKNEIRIIHHGTINLSRKLDKMIELMDYLDQRFKLDFILITPPQISSKTRSYIRKIKNHIKTNPSINLLPPVEPTQIVNFLNNYDIGLFLLEPVNFNYKNTLPNKLFEFIQARVLVAIGPSVEMAKIVEKYNCGIISDDFNPKTLADKLNELDTNLIRKYKQNSDTAAKELNADKNKIRMKAIIEKLIE